MAFTIMLLILLLSLGIKADSTEYLDLIAIDGIEKQTAAAADLTFTKESVNEFTVSSSDSSDRFMLSRFHWTDRVSEDFFFTNNEINSVDLSLDPFTDTIEVIFLVSVDFP